MNHVKQINPTTCGQSCIAMIFGVTIDEAIATIGHDGITSDEEICTALGVKNEFIEGIPPKNVVALQKHKSPDGTKEHWTISYYGSILDPANIGKRLWTCYKYLIL